MKIPMLPLGKLASTDVDRLSQSELRIYLNAARGVIRMKEIDLQRALVAQHYAEYNYHSAMLDKHKKLLEAAQESNRTGVDA